MTKGRLQDKVAIITGGASGIGAAAVKLFAQEGAYVFAIDRKLQMPNSTDESTDSHSITFVRTDVSKEAEVESVVAEVQKKAARIDILYNNAGIGLTGLLHETSIEDWDNILNVNLRSVFLMCKYTLPSMIMQQSGVIINTSSGIGVVGSRSHHAYSASKAGVVLLTRSLALGYAKYKIRANCICPGPIDTPMLDKWTGQDMGEDVKQQTVLSIPLGRLGKPEDVAYAALFLASDEASFVTGAVLPVDGGVLA
jgi:dihydroanticapsin dehydrogenase